MGSEIVYCFNCQTRLLASDFEKGGAVRFTDRVACVPCASEYMASLPPEEQDRAVKSGPAAPTRSVRPAPKKPAPTATPRKPTPAVPAEPSVAPKKRGLIVGAAAGGAVLLAVVILLATRGSGEQEVVVAQKKAEPEKEKPKAPDSAPSDPKFEAAQAALDRAERIAREKPDDFDAQVRAFEEAVRKSEGTLIHREAVKMRDAAVGRRTKAPGEALARLEAELGPLLAQKKFQAAYDAVAAARARFPLPEAAEKLKEIEAAAQALFVPLRDKAMEARRKGRAEEEKAVRDEVASWGVRDLLANLESNLASVEPPKTLSPAMQAFLPAWKAAAAKAAAREFEAAAAELRRAAKELKDEALRRDAEQDAADLLKVAAVHAEGLKALAAWPKGKRLDLEAVNPDGALVKVGGTLVRSAAGRGEIQTDAGPLAAVEWADVTGPALAELVAAAQTGGAEARILAIACLLEGNAEAAQRVVGGDAEKVAARFWDWAPEGAEKRPKPPPREIEARKLLLEADREFRRVETLAAAVARYRTLAADYGDTRGVREAEATVKARAAAGREYVLLPPEMKGSGLFRRAKTEKGSAVWVVAEEGEFSPHNWVEVRFAAVPEASYRMWVWAGACCVEVFAVDWQGSELTGPVKGKGTVAMEPGSESALPVAASLRGARAKHSGHGAKEPLHWGWIPFALPKYAAPGLKKVRIFSSRKGFQVAYAVVSATKTAPPTDAELREELARPRSEPEVVTEGLAGWWKLDEESGAVAQNSVEGGPPGTLRGSAVWKDRALHFDGSGGHVEIPCAGALEKLQEGSYTLAARFTPSQVPPGKDSQNDAASGIVIRPGRHTGLLYNHASQFIMEHWLDGGSQGSTGTWNDSFPPGKEYHVAGVVDPAQGLTRIFIDGVSKGDRKFDAGKKGLGYGKEPWRIGIANPGASEWAWPARGAIRDVRLYGRALGDAELKELSKAD